MIGKILLGIVAIYVMAAVYFGILKKWKIFKIIKKVLKILIFAIVIGIALLLLFPTLK